MALPLAIFGIENDGVNLAINLLILFLVVVYLALIAYTYLDARRRLEDPVLVGCATVASLFPFVGVIVYSILRPPEFREDRRERELEIRASELRVRQLEENSCPNCEHPVERTYLRCPSCRARIKDPCESCGKPVDPRWSLCPYCETPTRRKEPEAHVAALVAALVPAVTCDAPGLSLRRRPHRDAGAESAESPKRPAKSAKRSSSRTGSPRTSASRSASEPPPSASHQAERQLARVSRTLILVKPDAFERALTGEVLARFERKGLRIKALKLVQADEATANEHYAEHTEKPFFGELVEFITGGPLVAAVLRGARGRPSRPAADRRHEPDRSRARLDPRRLRPRGDLQHGPRLRLRRVSRARDRHLVPGPVVGRFSANAPTHPRLALAPAAGDPRLARA